MQQIGYEQLSASNLWLFLKKSFVDVWLDPNSLVIKQKGESQNGGNKKVKHTKFSEKRTLLTPRG